MKPVIVILALLAAGCSTTASDLPYSPAIAPIVQGSRSVSSVTVTDAREEKDPTYIGAIRGGLGNPIKTLTTSRPVPAEVQTAFETALRSRDLLGGPGRDTLDVRVTKLSANQLVRRDAQAAFTLSLRNPAGQQIYADGVDVEKVNGSLVSFDAGILASTADLRAIMLQAMTEAIDQALDKPGFVAATRPGS